MKKISIFLFALSLVMSVCTSCDDGRIYEKTVVTTEEGRVLKLTGEITGLSSWGDTYSVVVAGYSDESDYAVITKALPANHVDGEPLQLVMNGISEEVKTLKLCVINRLRKSIVDFRTLEEADLLSATDTIRMNIGTLDVDMYHSIQAHVFDLNCTSCHGQSTYAAAGLFLTEGKSYDALVNKHSDRNTEMLLVAPGDVEQSFLHVVLHNNNVISHDHLDILSGKTELLDLVDSWIKNGAQQ